MRVEEDSGAICSYGGSGSEEFCIGAFSIETFVLLGTCLYVSCVGVENGDEIRKAEVLGHPIPPVHILWYPYPVQVSRNKKLRSLLI